MATRPVVSYDDITLPYDPSEATASPPPSKKRKRNKKGTQLNRIRSRPRNLAGTLNQEADMEQEDEGEYDEESRELTHEEIWDDSALVDAWEAAQQEYEAYHGGNKVWKDEPVKKAPLWYNVPLDSSKSTNGAPPKPSHTGTGTLNAENVEHDSKPLNFDTFVPMHDPSLPVPPPPAMSNYQVDSTEGHMVSQDEAFSRAMNAMYWGGYWTAMYHYQRYLSLRGATANDEEVDAGESEGDDESEFVPTQL